MGEVRAGFLGLGNGKKGMVNLDCHLWEISAAHLGESFWASAERIRPREF
jgi:hypothetical protein